MLVPNEGRRTLADDHARRHGVAGRHPRHDRRVGNPQVVDAIDLQIATDNGHRIPTHLRRRCKVPIGRDAITDKALQTRLVQIARHHLAFDERAQGEGVADLAAQFHAGRCHCEIFRVREMIGLYL